MFCKHQNILVAAYYHYKKIDTERKNHLKIGALRYKQNVMTTLGAFFAYVA